MNTITPFELAQLVLLMKQQRGEDSDVMAEDISDAVMLLVECGVEIAEHRKEHPL